MQKKCPYFLSRTNGKKLYVNCSNTGSIQCAIRVEFNNIEERSLYYSNICCSERFTECYRYQDLREDKNEYR